MDVKCSSGAFATPRRWRDLAESLVSVANRRGYRPPLITDMDRVLGRDVGALEVMEANRLSPARARAHAHRSSWRWLGRCWRWAIWRRASLPAVYVQASLEDGRAAKNSPHGCSAGRPARLRIPDAIWPAHR
jgi:hypothetical protein